MNRKKFLELLALSYGGIFLAPSLYSCSGKDEEEINVKPGTKTEKVVIIGAGLSGLSAAVRLRDAGFTDVTILEARDRVGGRIWTDRSLGVPVDMGASWIHGPDGGNPLTPLAQKAGARTFMTDDESVRVYDAGGNPFSDGTIDTYYKRYNNLLKKIDRESSPNRSFRDVVASEDPSALTDKLMNYQFAAYAEFDSGGPIEELSSAFWEADEKFPGKDVLFPNGYDAIPNLLAQGLNIKLKHVVSKIEYGATSSIVKTDKGDFPAKFVIVTLPLGVLKRNKIEFSPALPSVKRDAISRLGMGYINKVALLFDRAFWDRNLQYVGYAGEVKGQYSYFLNVAKFAPVNMLMTFGFGNYGKVIENQNNAQVQADVMSVLRKIYGNSIPEPQNILVSRWSSDPYAHGAYSFSAVNSFQEDYDRIAETVENKLFFAGEHTISKYRSTAHGAILSGIREAEKIMRL